MSTWQKDQKRKALIKAEEMLAYWKNKSVSFWVTWKGHSKNTILTSWAQVIKLYAAELKG